MQSNSGIQGLSPGEDTIQFLAARRRQLKLLNAALLAALSLAASAVDAAAVALLGTPAGCLSLLLLASTVASGARQVRGGWRAGHCGCCGCGVCTAFSFPHALLLAPCRWRP